MMAGIVIPGPGYKAPPFVVDRKPTSLERLCMRLMARAMSRRRAVGTRLVAVVLLVPVALLALGVKAIGGMAWMVERLAAPLFMVALGWAFWRTDPALHALARQDLAGLGRLLLSLAHSG